MLREPLDEPWIGDRIVHWVLRIAVAAFWATIGFEKFSSSPTSEWIGIFQRIGVGTWFRYFTGVVEMLGGALFLVPRTTIAGAALLATSMVGATIAHFTVLHDPGSSVITLILLASVVALGFYFQPTRPRSPRHWRR